MKVQGRGVSYSPFEDLSLAAELGDRRLRSGQGVGLSSSSAGSAVRERLRVAAAVGRFDGGRFIRVRR